MSGKYTKLLKEESREQSNTYKKLLLCEKKYRAFEENLRGGEKEEATKAAGGTCFCIQNFQDNTKLHPRVFFLKSHYLWPEISRVLSHKRYATKYGLGYIMVVTVRTAHNMFCDEHQQKISLSLFAKLRPRNIRKLGAIAVETCLCIYCTNIREHLDDPITWHRWEREAGADGKLKLDIHFKSGSLMDLLEELYIDLERPVKGTSFFQHLFSAFWHFSQYKELKMSLQPGQGEFCRPVLDLHYQSAEIVSDSSDGSDMTVSFLRQRGNAYVFPDVPEIVAVSTSHDNVLSIKLLKAPIVSARGRHFYY
ncbi:hypothetical protein PoB_005859700 [Plakobranchus ocellatus]|uniref:Uncharacterized protein n=1 Tax=Plakobranchus ocellatus TaxID=259542 RepID=A0AAV4CKL4_9GAST|nr:hypothetical protein PoB_005859700 [Plakobranchus ocellatus]